MSDSTNSDNHENVSTVEESIPLQHETMSEHNQESRSKRQRTNSEVSSSDLTMKHTIEQKTRPSNDQIAGPSNDQIGVTSIVQLVEPSNDQPGGPFNNPIAGSSNDNTAGHYNDDIAGPSNDQITRPSNVQITRAIKEDVLGEVSKSNDEEALTDGMNVLRQGNDYKTMLSLFPGVCPQFLLNSLDSVAVGEDRMVTQHQFHQLVESLLERMVELPIKEEEEGEKEDVVTGLGTQHYFQELVTIFPDVCPEYLSTRLSAIVGEERLDREKTSQFNNLVEELLGVENLPTRREWLARRRNQEEVTEYTEQMTAEQFLDLYPDPAAYFSNTNRPLIKDQEYRDHALYDLLLRFPFQAKNKVVQAFNRSGKLYIPAVNDLSRQLNTRMSRRINDRNAGLPRLRTPHCKELLKEKKFLELKDQIEWLITSRKEERKALLARARAMGELYQCCCCYGDEMLQDEMVVCEAEIGHLHCQECVTNNVRNVLGEGKVAVFCCQPDCVQEIGCKNLSQILEPVLWSKYLEKKTELEVRSAGLDGLVNCPFCPFAAVLEDEDRVFMCRNSECGINSCRLCHRPNHIPLTCEELNQKADTARQEMEESMTNALLRQCWRCHRRFYKEEGCNRVTCTHCNAKTCYLCGAQDLDGYNHFYGAGGVRTETQTCPLWSNTKEMHRVAVAEAEREGKAKLDKFRNI